jgi:glycosyltransferase involved in cell wall biosynthesis
LTDDSHLGKRTLKSVLIASTLRPVGTVGVETHIRQAADILAKRGARVQIVTPDSFLPMLGPAIRVAGRVLLRSKKEAAVRLYRDVNRRFVHAALKRAFKAERPSAVYAQDPRAAEAALNVRASNETPVVMIVHYNESQAEELVTRGLIKREGYTYRATREFEAMIVPRLDGLVFVSDFTRQRFLDKLPGGQNVPSAIIPNFVHDVQVSPAVIPSRDCINVGSLVEHKNHRYLLHVLATARRHGHRYTLTVAGDGPLRERLEGLARELGIAEQVAFLGRRSDIERLLPQHRIYVHSSLMDNFPFAVIEALRAGLPVVTSQVGGIPEMIGSDGAGRFWDPNDAEGGARVLAGLLEDKAALSNVARQARLRFETKYDAVVAGDQLARFLGSAGSKPHSPK